MRLAILFFALATLIPGITVLHADTVVLANGDRLTGTIRYLRDGRLELQSEYLGTLEVKWKDIRSITSDANFSVRTREGERHHGHLTMDEDKVNLLRDGLPRTTVPSETVVSIARGGRGSGIRSVVTAVHGSADIGYTLSRGNQNQHQSSLGASAEYASATYKVNLRLDSLFAAQHGARSQSRHALFTTLDRFIGARLYVFALSGLERNERRRLDLRSRFGGGVGWMLANRGRTRLGVFGGFASQHELFREVADRLGAEAFSGLTWRTRFFKSIDWEMRLQVQQSQVDRGRARIEYDGTLKIPIAGPFKYTLRLFDRYDTRPAANVERNDYGIVSGLGVVF